jgi:RimJ/RimL family protein N-acetyltransferase
MVELRRATDDDLWLTEALETDPAVMSHLGGPLSLAEAQEDHRRRVGDPWWLVIVIDGGETAVGTIGIWPTVHGGTTIHETGWMVLPAFQGRGFASAALGLLIERVRADPAFEAMHAFPPVGNGPSNALCRKFGFALLEEVTGVYAGRTLRCNHWALSTRPVPPRERGSAP